MTPKEALNSLFVLASEYHQKLWCLKLAPVYPEAREKYIDRIVKCLPNDGGELNDLYDYIKQAIDKLEVLSKGKEAEKSIQKDYNNAMKLLKRYWQNRGAIKEDGQGKLIDCNGQVITDESLAKRFQIPFDYKPKKYKLSELIKQNGIAIHTPTEENANDLLKVLDRLGYEWCNLEKLTSSNEYQKYGQNTCYTALIRLNGKTYIEYCSLSFYEKKGREIVEFTDIDLEN